MPKQIVNDIKRISFHCTAGSFYMSAAIKIRCNFAYIYIIVGTHAYFKFKIIYLISEDSNLYSIGNTHLVDNPI